MVIFNALKIAIRRGRERVRAPSCPIFNAMKITASRARNLGPRPGGPPPDPQLHAFTKGRLNRPFAVLGYAKLRRRAL